MYLVKKSRLIKLIRTGRIFYLAVLLLFVAPPTSGEVIIETENEITERVYITQYSEEKATRRVKDTSKKISRSSSSGSHFRSPQLAESNEEVKLFILYCTFKYYD